MGIISDEKNAFIHEYNVRIGVPFSPNVISKMIEYVDPIVGDPDELSVSNVVDIYNGLVDKKIKYYSKSKDRAFIFFLRFLIDEGRYKFNRLPKAFKYALQDRNIFKYLRMGVKAYYFRNLLDKAPNDELYVFVPQYENLFGTNAHNIGFSIVDLRRIRNCELKEELNEHIWEDVHALNEITILIDFVVFREKRLKRTYRLNVEGIIPPELLAEYRGIIENRIRCESTLRARLKGLRSFLHSLERKGHYIAPICYSVITLKGLSDEKKNKKTIPDDDLKLIYETIEKDVQLHPENEVYKILFEVALCSNIRIGEIVNIERDKVFDDYVLIKKKMGDEMYKKEVCSSETIALINRAKILTSELAPNKYVGKYVFIQKTYSNIGKGATRIRFQHYLDQISKQLDHKLTGKLTSYDLRHKYIDSVYAEGIKKGRSINEIALVAGNSFKTARKYYRDRSLMQSYVEAISLVDINDSEYDIMGSICEEDENEGFDVLNKLGKCKHNSCMSDMGVCLTCPSFKTFISRKENYKQRIIETNVALCEENLSEHERTDIIMQRMLLTKYYYRIIEVENERGRAKREK